MRDTQQKPETAPDTAVHADISDAEIMAKIVDGQDETAFQQLVGRYRRRVFATCYRTLGRYEEAEEAAQESFFKLWTYAHKWDSRKAGVSTWLYTIVTNTCRDVLRKRKAIFVEHDEETTVAGAFSGPQNLEERQDAARVKNAVLNLPERQRQALVLSYYQGFSHKEIAEITGRTPKSIEGLIARARNDLKDQLSDLNGDEI